MGKSRNLNGLPNNLTQRFFSTLFPYQGGYMACWLWKISKEKGIYNFEIDIINQKTVPEEINSKPFLTYLPHLKKNIEEELERNGFVLNHIKKAILNISVSKIDEVFGIVSCVTILEDVKGKIYTGKVYKENAYPISDSLMNMEPEVISFNKKPWWKFW